MSAHFPCSSCKTMLATPAQIERHNRRCADTGERSYAAGRFAMLPAGSIGIDTPFGISGPPVTTLKAFRSRISKEQAAELLAAVRAS